MNKYESNIMVNTVIMKVFYVVIVLVNLLLPYHRDWHWSFSIFQLAIVITWFFGLMGGLGYFNQNTPILPLGIIRILQIGLYLLFKHKAVNWIIIGIYLALDATFLLFLLFDKANYEYVEENRDGN